MATTPKRSLKRTLASTVEDRTPRFLLGSLALAMVISLLAGLGIGMKVEQHRVESKKAKTSATATTKKKKKKTTAKRTALGTGPLFATIVSSRPPLLVVSRGASRVRLVMVKTTQVQLAAPATSAAIVAGAHVIVTLKPKPATGTITTGSTTATTGITGTASTVIVVSGTSAARLGSVVTAATTTSMTVKLGTSTATISTAGAKIFTTTNGTKANLAAGRKVVIRTYRAPAPKRKKKKAKTKKAAVRSTFAIEIVELPAGSTFS